MSYQLAVCGWLLFGTVAIMWSLVHYKNAKCDRCTRQRFVSYGDEQFCLKHWREQFEQSDAWTSVMAEDWDDFVEWVDDPPEDMPKLKRLLESESPFERKNDERPKT